MRQFCLLLTVALVSVVSCTQSSVGITNPTQIEQDLVGSWLQVSAPAGQSTNFTLAVSDTVVTGTGHWTGEASTGGNLVVTGVITETVIVLQIDEDNGVTIHYEAQMLAPNLISGEFIGAQTRQAVSYQRVDSTQ